MISPTVDAQGSKRSWKKTQAAAVKHGKGLLASNAGKPGRGRRLLVVRVVEVLELPGPNIVSRLEADDLNSDLNSDEESKF